MKRSILFLLMMVAVCCVQAQSIREGDTFWSGKVLYKATVTPLDEVMLKGLDARGAKYAISLLKVSKSGEYELKAIDESRPAPYGCYYGARVRLMKRQGFTFLAFYVGEEEIGQILMNTPEDLPTLARQQQYAEQANVLEHNGETLMNQKLLSTVKPEVLDLLGNYMEKRNKTFIQRTNRQMVAFADSKQMFMKDLEPWFVAPPQPIEQITKDKTTSARPDVKKKAVHIVDMDDIEEDTTKVDLSGKAFDFDVDELFKDEKRVKISVDDLEEDDDETAPKPKAKTPIPAKVDTPEPAKVDAPEPVKAETPVKVEAPEKVETPVKVEAPAEVDTPIEVPAEAPASPAEAPASKNPLKKLKKL